MRKPAQRPSLYHTIISELLIPSEMRMALLRSLEDSTFVARHASVVRHSGFFFLMRIRKKKTGIHRSGTDARVPLWIPVFFGRVHPTIQSMTITLGICVMSAIAMRPPEKTGMTLAVVYTAEYLSRSAKPNSEKTLNSRASSGNLNLANRAGLTRCPCSPEECNFGSSQRTYFVQY